MSLLEVKDLTREFKILNRREGLKGAVKDLFSRDYKTLTAVDHVNFSIDEGEIVGFIGSNGAGKSTTIKMMTGLIKPTSGYVNVMGYNPMRDRKEYLKNIGVVFGQRTQLWWELPVIESFRLLKDVYEVSDKDYNEMMSLFQELADIKKLYMTPVRNLSLGQRMLCDIAASFLHNPKIIFLDEPTIGLDVNIKSYIRGMIRHLNRTMKTTVVLTTHDTGDIEELADRIILIDKGKILYDGEAFAFHHVFGAYKTVKVKLKEADLNRVPEVMERISNALTRFSDVKIQEREAGWIHVIINNELVQIDEVIKAILEAYQCKDLMVNDVELASVLQRVYNGDAALSVRRES